MSFDFVKFSNYYTSTGVSRTKTFLRKTITKEEFDRIDPFYNGGYFRGNPNCNNLMKIIELHQISGVSLHSLHDQAVILRYCLLCQ